MITHTTAATLMAVVLRLLFHPGGCLRTMDSPPAGMNPKHMDMLAVLLAAL
jgi:hypothetical protein